LQYSIWRFKAQTLALLVPIQEGQKK